MSPSTAFEPSNDPDSKLPTLTGFWRARFCEKRIPPFINRAMRKTIFFIIIFL
jgi:hypothetical protein